MFQTMTCPFCKSENTREVINEDDSVIVMEQCMDCSQRYAKEPSQVLVTAEHTEADPLSNTASEELAEDQELLNISKGLTKKEIFDKNKAKNKLLAKQEFVSQGDTQEDALSQPVIKIPEEEKEKYESEGKTKQDGTGPRSGSTGPRDGRGQGNGRAGGNGVGRRQGGELGNCDTENEEKVLIN